MSESGASAEVPRPRDRDSRQLIRTVVLDHQSVFLDALALTLRAEPDIDVVHAARSLDAQAGLPREVDVFVLGVDEPAALAQLRRIRRRWPSARCVALDGEGDLERLADALRAGTRALVQRSDPPQRLVDAVRAAARDDTDWPPGLLTRTLDLVLTAPSTRSGDEEQLLEQLTRREREVLAGLVQGYSRGEIAARLYLSPNTVRTHVGHLLAKLEVRNCVAAVALARRAGWLPDVDRVGQR